MFILNPVPFNGQSYQKQRGLELVTIHSSGCETSFTTKFIYYLCIIWPSLMMKGKAIFELFQKWHLEIYTSHFITNNSTSICPVESGNCRKEGEKLQTFEYLENEKSFLDEIFHSFWRAIIWWKNKNLIISSGHKH